MTTVRTPKPLELEPFPGSLVSVTDLTREGFLGLVHSARDLKRDRRLGHVRTSLDGRNIALLFEKPSTRTRCAFEVAVHELGAHATCIAVEDTHLGYDESVADTARVLGRMYDGIAVRGCRQETVEDLASHAGIPVWNGLSDTWHPTQALADVMTLLEATDRPVHELSVAYVGDGRTSVAHTLLVTGALLGLDVRIAAPGPLQPGLGVRSVATALASGSGARITVTADPESAVRGVGAIYTGAWVGTGEAEASWRTRIPQLLPYRVTPDLLAASGNPEVRFMHCLPAVHDVHSALGRRLSSEYGLSVGVEVSDEVFRSSASVVFDQAENRLHTVKAVMLAAYDIETVPS